MKLNQKALGVLLIGALVIVGVIGGVASVAQAAPATSGWTTVLDDEFTSAGIPSHWSLYNGPYGSGQHNCAAPSQDSAPGDGYLYLQMSYLTSGKCGAGWYTGGMMISSVYDFPEQAITVRYRILPSATPSAVYSHHIIPMAWPDDPAYQWYQAEADYCESSSAASCTTYLHDGQGSQVSHGYTLDQTQWHTLRFEQQSDTLTASIDGALVWTYNGTATSFPDALRRLVLQQECPADGCPSAAYAGESERIQIDYVRIDVPSGASAASSPTPAPTTPPTPIPTPANTPSPTPQPTPTGVPCVELVAGVMTTGTCVGTFTPAG